MIAVCLPNLLCYSFDSLFVLFLCSLFTRLVGGHSLQHDHLIPSYKTMKHIWGAFYSQIQGFLCPAVLISHMTTATVGF